MKDFFKAVGLGFLAVVLILGLVWIVQGNDFFMLKVFGPKVQEVQRQIFEESPSYQLGTIQELQDMRREYITSGPEEQIALRAIILQRADGYRGEMPADLRAFINELELDQTQSELK